MSKQLKPLKNTGSRGVELDVVRYSGGKAGPCVQLTGEMEEIAYGTTGYVQLNKNDIKELYRRFVLDEL